MRADIRGERRRRKEKSRRWTYNRQAADGYQVPDQVFPSEELGVRRLELPHVLEGCFTPQGQTRLAAQGVRECPY